MSYTIEELLPYSKNYVGCVVFEGPDEAAIFIYTKSDQLVERVDLEPGEYEILCSRMVSPNLNQPISELIGYLKEHDS